MCVWAKVHLYKSQFYCFVSVALSFLCHACRAPHQHRRWYRIFLSRNTWVLLQILCPTVTYECSNKLKRRIESMLVKTLDEHLWWPSLLHFCTYNCFATVAFSRRASLSADGATVWSGIFTQRSNHRLFRSMMATPQRSLMMEIEIKFGKGRSDRVKVHYDDDADLLADVSLAPSFQRFT